MKCSGCGKCCVHTNIAFVKEDYEKVKHLLPDGSKKPVEYLTQVAFYDGCPFLDESNKCIIHEMEERPLDCKIFPIKPENDDQGKINLIITLECENWMTVNNNFLDKIDKIMENAHKRGKEMHRRDLRKYGNKIYFEDFFRFKKEYTDNNAERFPGIYIEDWRKIINIKNKSEQKRELNKLLDSLNKVNYFLKHYK